MHQLKMLQNNTNRLEELFEANYGLLVSQAISFRPRNQDELDDFIQAGSIGMINAIKTYNPKMSALSTHICNCVKNSIINFIKANKKHKAFDINNNIEQKSSDLLFEYLPDNLTDIDYLIINMKLQGLTRKEMAKQLNCKENNVKYKVKKTFEKIRNANEN